MGDDDSLRFAPLPMKVPGLYSGPIDGCQMVIAQMLIGGGAAAGFEELELGRLWVRGDGCPLVRMRQSARCGNWAASLIASFPHSITTKGVSRAARALTMAAVMAPSLCGGGRRLSRRVVSTRLSISTPAAAQSERLAFSRRVPPQSRSISVNILTKERGGLPGDGKAEAVGIARGGVGS